MSDKSEPNGFNTRLILSLDEIEGSDLPLVGGKAFRLAMLKQQGFNVPPGLVLTTKFFKTQIKHAKLMPLWAGSPDIAVTEDALNWLADALKTTPLAPLLNQTFKAKMSLMLGAETASFAVRSSAIDEDHHDHTFAGVHLTELSVPQGVIPISITRCWASALSDAAVKYRQMHGMSIQSIQIAVLIQAMLTPISAGVGFTVNPLTGNRDELVIEATWGTGNALVSGDIQPYFYRLANQPPDYPLLEYHAGNVPPPSADVAPSVGAAPLVGALPSQEEPLSPQERIKLARQLEEIQVFMGEAQDVEWAKQGDTFFLLQTRPVAVMPELEQGLDNEWTRGHHPEDLPELPSPFFGALLENVQNQAIAFYQDIGLKVDNLGPYQKIILGRPYLNLTFLKRGMAQVGINPDSFLQTMGYMRVTTTENVFSIDWRSAWQSRRVYWLAIKRIFSMRQHVDETENIVNKVIKILNNPNLEAPAIEVIDQLHQQDRIYRALFTTDLGLTLAIGFITGLGSRLIESISQTPATTLSTLALSGVKTGKDELHQALVAFSETIQDDPQVEQYLTSIAAETSEQTPTPPPEFQPKFDALLSRYGERATYEADPSCPRYRDDPKLLLNIVKQYAANRATSTAPSTSITWQSLTTTAGGIERFLPWRRWLTRPLVGLLHRFFLMQGHLDDKKAKVIAACRYWNLTLGQKWADLDWLAKPEDIFWLTLDEIERVLLMEEEGTITLSSTIRARKETYQTYNQTEMPFYLKESQLTSIQLGIGPADELPSDVMIGLPISPGQARGVVMVVRNPADFQKSSQDDLILVMPSTDPAWLALLHSASGLIVETGGLLSHGSVIAREYGLPAVANIPQATQRFKSGDTVLVDGSTGVVQLLESSQTTL